MTKKDKKIEVRRKIELIESLKTIPDFRVDKGKITYPLYEVLFMTLFALMKGNTTFKDIFTWLCFNEDNQVLKRILNKDKLEIPSKSTLHHILINVDNNAFEKVFREFFEIHSKKDNIAIDGKWLNGSDVDGQYTKDGHKSILNIFDKDSKIVFAHKFMDKEKKSEIKAFEELLEDKTFTKEKQIFSFDALLTQTTILNNINAQGSRYIAKVKGNQENLRKKVIETIENYDNPVDSYEDKDSYINEEKQYVTRIIDVYQNKSMNIVVYDSKFDNIESLIRVTKIFNDISKNETYEKVDYCIANFKMCAEEFSEKILQHWRVETYHYHLDVLLKEDEHIAYKEPFSISILRSFALNLYQLFLNENRDKKVFKTGKTTMSEIKRNSQYRDDFTAELFEA